MVGDPLLRREPDPGAYPARADVETLAALTADALEERGRTTVRLRYDATLFDGPAFNPRWPDSYRGDVVAPITSLWVDGGRPEVGFGRVADPARAAADAFARALAAEGLTVQGDPTAGRARRAADPVAEVSSAPVAQLVDHALQVSDNEVTEVLLRHVGLATSGEGSSAAGTAGVEQALTDLGVPLPTALYDGSGLSRENLISPATLTGLLREVAVSDPTDPLRVLLPGLPVAAFSGSLTTRFDDAPAVALGQVRAKTGTLRSVRSLSGVAVSRDGTPMVFALMVDRVPDLADEAAEDVLDRAAAALAACRCGRDVGSTP